MGAGGSKLDPVRGCQGSCRLEALALSSRKVFQCTWSFSLASRNSTAPSAVPRPVALKVACAIAATQHSYLYCHLLYLMAGAAT